MMKKVTILSLHLGYGGIEKSIAALANLLCKKYKVEIACVYKLFDKPVFEIDDKVNIIYLTDVIPNHEEIRKAKKSKNFIKIIKEYSYGVKVLSKRKQSMINFILHCNSDYIISTRDIFNDWLGAYGKTNSIKIGWEHNHYHDNLKYADNVVRSVKNLDYFVLVSKNLRDYYSKRLMRYNVKCFYIPNIIDNLPKKTSPLEEMRIVSVGRLSPEKGYMDLLKIFKLLHQDHKDWTLDIYGNGNTEPYESLTRQMSIDTSRCHLHGPVTDVLKKYYSSSIFVLPSRYEGFGLVLIEAMACGVPVVAFDCENGPRSIITDGVDGFLIPPFDIDAFAEKVILLMNDDSLRKKMGENAQRTSSLYDIESVGFQWRWLFDELIAT